MFAATLMLDLMHLCSAWGLRCPVKENTLESARLLSGTGQGRRGRGLQPDLTLGLGFPAGHLHVAHGRFPAERRENNCEIPGRACDPPVESVTPAFLHLSMKCLVSGGD